MHKVWQREDKPLAPRVDTVNNLPIAEVLLSGDNDPVVTITGQRVFKMTDIEKLYSSIKDNEYNIGKMALQIDLSERGMNLKNSFVEPFDGDTLRDEGLESVNGYIKAMAVNGVLTFNVDWTINSLNPVNLSEWGTSPERRFLTMGTSGTTSVLVQPHYTKTRQINEFMFVAPPRASIRVTPSEYKWIDRDIFLNFVQSIESRNWLSNLTNNWWWSRVMRSRNISTSTSSVSSIDVSSAPSIIPQIPLVVESNNWIFQQW